MTLINGSLTKPITTSEIASCIGDPGGDIGHLCISNNINPLSRYKPFSSSVADLKYKAPPLTLVTITAK